MKFLRQSTAISLALAVPLALASVGTAAAQSRDATAQAEQRQQSDRMQARRPMHQQQQQQAQQTQQDAQVPQRVLVTSASDLAGDKLVDSRGRRAGEIRYVMIDAATGAVQYAIVDTGSRQGSQQLIAVPWPMIDVPFGRPDVVRVNAPEDRLQQAPTFGFEQLAELTEPRMVTRVYRYYASPDGSQATGGQATGGQATGGRQQPAMQQLEQALSQAALAVQQDDRRQAQRAIRRAQRTLERSEPRREATRGDGDGPKQQLQQALSRVEQALEDQGQPEQAQQALQQAQQALQQAMREGSDQPQAGRRQAMREAPAQQQASRQRARQQQTGQQQAMREGPGRQQAGRQQTQQDGATGRPAILVGRGFVTMLAPPLLTTGDQLSGTVVTTSGGQPIGEIDQLMIDTERGHVAYVLLSRGGYLGMEQQWLPVPMQALQWSAEAGTYQVAASPAQLESMPALAKQDLPTHVRGAQLADLYARYDVMPYWEMTGVGRAALGVQIQPVGDQLAQALQLEEARGALVADVVEGSPAAEAGIQPGDVILSVNGQEISGTRELSRQIADAPVGSKAEITVWRNGSEEQLQATLQPMQPMQTAAGRDMGGQPQQARQQQEPEALGLTLTTLTPEMQQYLDLSALDEGAVIVDLQVDSIAANSGLQPGDVIVQVGDRQVANAEEAAQQVRRMQQGNEPILLRVNRGGVYRYVALPS